MDPDPVETGTNHPQVSRQSGNGRDLVLFPGSGGIDYHLSIHQPEIHGRVVSGQDFQLSLSGDAQVAVGGQDDFNAVARPRAYLVSRGEPVPGLQASGSPLSGVKDGGITTDVPDRAGPGAGHRGGTSGDTGNAGKEP